MSIRTRLIATFSISLIIVIGVIAYIVFSSARESSIEAFHEFAVSQLERVEERINTFIEPGVMSVKYLADMNIVRDSRGKLTNYLDTKETTTLLYANHPPHERLIYDEFIRVSNSNKNFGLVFMANDDGQYAQAPEGYTKLAGYDPRKRGWYVEAINDKRDVTVTSPYLTTGGGVVCSIMVKTRDLQGRPLGLLGVDYSLQSLTNDFDKRRVSKTGYLVVFDANGRIITDGRHSNYVAMEPKDYPDIRKKMAALSDGVMMNIGERGAEEYIVMKTVDSLGWKIAVIFDRAEMFESSYKLLRTILFTSVVVFLLALILLLTLARGILRPIEKLREAMSAVYGGDMTARVGLNGKDELSEVAQSVDRVVAEQRDFLLELREQGDRIDHNTEELEDVFKNAESMASAIAGHARSLSRAADENSEEVEVLSAGIEEMSAAATGAASSAASVSADAEQLKKNAEASDEMIRLNMASVENMAQAFKTVSTQVQNLDSKAVNINNIVVAITGIADQTNLLALNAAIEAARAGEAGRGFAVVAEEVRKLAENSNKAAGQIGELARDIASETRSAVERASDGLKLATDTENDTRKTQERLSDVISAVARIVAQIHNVATTSEGQSASLAEMAASVERVTKSATGNKEKSAEIAGQVDNITETIGGVAKTMDSLRGMVASNSEHIARFTLE
ncbi:methyl-accepting chemotaxis protein [Synergistales bacterium]|nr:methyl-accepting chemotaxis protein [Synergistales bacterium]